MGYWCCKVVIYISISFYDWCIKNKPELLKEWDYEENNKLGITPQNITCGSEKKVWWICQKGHKYEQMIYSKVGGYRCPYCSNKKVLVGYNDLKTTHPEIAHWWHPTKNGKLNPTDVTYGSSKKIWWICEHGHEYEREVRQRVKTHNCPYCTGIKIIKGKNDLATTHPDVAKQWHTVKNKPLTPNDVSFGSNRVVWWISADGYEWQEKIINRSRIRTERTNPIITFKNGKLSNSCNIFGSSRSELTVLFYIVKYADSEVMHRFKHNGYEIDIYIPKLKTGIEYDGVRYHKDISKDIMKNENCKADNIKLYRIREQPLEILNDYSIDIGYNPEKIKEFNNVISNLIKQLFNKKVNIDIDEDYTKISSFIKFRKVKNSLNKTHPELAKEWHPTKNKNITPEHVTHGSNIKVWWMCKYGHEWQANISSRTKGSNCPYCSHNKVLSGFNDLGTLYAELAKEWHPTKNGDIKPTNVLARSAKKVWWMCEYGHEWKADLHSRTAGNGCPYCSGKKVLIGFNDLATTHPELAKEWHPTKNESIKPTDVTANSNKKVWWICKFGHEWQATPNNRAQKSGCPYCSGKKAIKGKTDLATTHPELAKEWHPTKNGDVKPTGIMAGTHKKFWWINSKGEEQFTSPNSKSRKYRKQKSKPIP